MNSVSWHDFFCLENKIEFTASEFQENGTTLQLLMTLHLFKRNAAKSKHYAIWPQSVKNIKLPFQFLNKNAQVSVSIDLTTVVSYQNESFSSKWEQPLLLPSSLELWRKERAEKAALILIKKTLSIWLDTTVALGPILYFLLLFKANLSCEKKCTNFVRF